MKILSHFQHLQLTNDQRAAVEQLHAFLESDDRVFILQGYAGSGKTTLLKGFVEYLTSIEKNYQLMAPTGRAAKVINQKTGHKASTVHKGIYSFKELEEIDINEEENGVSFLYQFKLANNIKAHNTVLVVDEASMVGDICSQGEFFRFGSGHLLQDLITYSRIQDPSTTSKIIFVGDPAQLPPIGMNSSPALDPEYLERKYHTKAVCAEIKEVKRQNADNGILQASKKIRQCLTASYFNDFDLRENKRDLFTPPYQEYLATYKAQATKKIIVCYKNKTAQNLNREIRQDKFGADLPIQKSDIAIIGNNNYNLGIMNGEFAVILEAGQTTESRNIAFYIKGGDKKTVRLTWRNVSLLLAAENNQTKTVNGKILENYLYGDNYLKPEEQRALYIDFKNRYPKLKKGTEGFKEAIINDPYFNCILLKFGYAVTCHKAQGGEWPSAFVFWDRGTQKDFDFYQSAHNRTGKTNSDFYRWAYTAVTRASEKLFCINPPHFSSFSAMKFVDTEVQEAFNVLTGQQNLAQEISINEALPVLATFGLADSPPTIQDHFIHRWHCLQQHGIQISDWKRVGYEIRYVFDKEGQTAAFKYWVNGKNVFKPKFEQLPAQTNSNELFERVTKLIANAAPISVNRKSAESKLIEVTFDAAIEEEKPYLKNLFHQVCRGLKKDGLVTGIQHLQFRERYTIENAGGSCVIDFEYDGDGFFGRVLPLASKCSNVRLLAKIKAIVENLKENAYVV